MKTRLLLAAVLLLVTGLGVGASVASERAMRRPAVPQPVLSVSAFWATGPAAHYDGDAGSIGEVRKRRFTVPDEAARYDAAVTLGLQYRTHGDSVFVGGLLVARAGTYRYLDIVPDVLRLAAAPSPTSTTLTFRVTGLIGGRTYAYGPTVNAGFGGRNISIRASRVVVDVRLTPAA